jgi:hypothetical protein
MVRIRIGQPSKEMNCLGKSPPMRRPFPPATIITYFSVGVIIDYFEGKYAKKIINFAE